MMNTMGNSDMMGNQMPRMMPTIAPRTQYLPGRFINDESEINPAEIPMNGSISFFCTNDLSRIIIKQWNSQCGLDTMTYTADRQKAIVQDVQSKQQEEVPVPQAAQSQSQSQAQAAVQPDQMQELIATIAALTKNIETAFNNFGANIQQSIGALSERIDNMEGGRG